MKLALWWAVCFALGFFVMMALQGCAVSRTAEGDMSLSLFQLGASDEIQTSSLTVIGLAVLPAQATGYLGYVRVQANRIPTYDTETLVPDVAITTSVSPTGPYVIESLAVGQLTREAEKRTFMQRLLPGGQ